MSIVWRNSGAEGEVVRYYGCRHGGLWSLLLMWLWMNIAARFEVYVSGSIVWLLYLTD